MSTNYEDDIAVGKPSIQEILEYFSCEGSKHIDSSVPSSSNTSGCASLDESFQEFLQQKIQEKLKLKMNAFKNTSDLNDSVDIEIGMMGGDDTFTRMERFCNHSIDEPVPVQLDNNDITQLNEINEPSMLWENTMQKMSPVKLCGVLRPSTIMEEDSQDISNTSTKSIRTETTVKDNATRESLSVYKTANETESSSSTVPSSLENLIDFDTPCAKKKHYYYDDKGNFISPRSSSGASHDVSEYITAASNGRSEEDIIEVSSSDESAEKTESVANTLDDVSSLNEDVSFEPDSLDIKLESPTKSLNFNDTIEEMDYMMKQGLKLMQEKKNVLTPIPITIKSNSPNRYTPSTPVFKKREAIKPVYKPHSASKSSNGSTNSDLAPKSFKKPSSSKVPSAKKKGGYDYIVSPIGMYIKSTPFIPLTKTGNSCRDIFESKLAHIRDSTASSNGNESIQQKPEKNNSPCPFPRKAYIASENNHVVDERVNPRIMGGEKVHRLFGGYNRSPTITKHQGRIKITNSSGKKENKPVDDSFKDLSLISSDVSFQVIKSAKKY